MPNNKPELVTFIVFAYNQEKYIREAVESAFAQTYEPMEIILSDDCSTDGTFDIMRQMAESYRGPHKVLLNRNSVNLKIGDHVNVAARLALGDFIVLSAGDDISVPHRTKQLLSKWMEIGAPPAIVCSDYEPVDKRSEPVILYKERVFRGSFTTAEMAKGNVRVLGATVAATRDIFSAFPLLHSSVRHEDRVLPFRALLLNGSVCFVDEKLVKYRIEGGVSRTRAKSARDYLFHHMPNSLEKLLPDAIQRLSDLEIVNSDDQRTRRQCLSTIADHRSHISLANGKGLDLERRFIYWLTRGARRIPLAKLYLKFRLFYLFKLYYDYMSKADGHNTGR